MSAGIMRHGPGSGQARRCDAASSGIHHAASDAVLLHHWPLRRCPWHRSISRTYARQRPSPRLTPAGLPSFPEVRATRVPTRR